MSMRGRWMTLAAVGVVLLGAGWFVNVRGWPFDRGTIAFSAAGPMSIWPESPLDPEDALRVEQGRVDGGGDQWRLNAEEVVARFAQSVFGWVSILVADPPDAPVTGPVTYRLREDCPGCDDSAGSVEVTVDRLLGERPGTAWSVVAVTSPRLHLPVEAGDAVVAGQSLPIGLDLAQDRHAAVGLRYVQGGVACGDGLAGEAAVTAADVSVTVPDPLFADEACTAAAGYVFAYSTSRLTVQTGDPLLEPAYVADLSIVPVRFSQEPVAPRP